MGIITISRGSFPGGKAVAEQLANRLGHPVLYGVNWDDPSQYDLVLNLERVGVASACDW
jgi:hypothetical protein